MTATRVILALSAMFLLTACADLETDMSDHGQVMQTTMAQGMPPYHVTQSFSAQR